MKSQQFFISALFLFISATTTAQNNVGIGTTSPDPSAILDITSDSLGVLIPRHSTDSRMAIANPALGLLVFDTTQNGLFCFDTTEWIELSQIPELVDADGDTRIHVEKNMDEDIIRFEVAGLEGMRFDGNTLHLRPSSDSCSLFLGKNAGVNNTGPGNTFIGGDAGKFNTNAHAGTFVGFRAGESNIGAENTIVGHRAGQLTTIGVLNTFLGAQTGQDNVTGDRNVYLGAEAGRNAVSGDGNVFIGHEAGKFETGSNKLYIENSSADSTGALIWGDFAADMVRINGALSLSGGKFTPFFGGSFTDVQWDDKLGTGLSTWGIAQRDVQDLYLRGLQGVVVDRGNFFSPNGEFAVRFRESNTTFRTDFLIDKDGHVGIGTTTPHSSALLDLFSGTKGVLLPRHSSLSRLGIVDPAQGLMVYDTTLQAVFYYDSTQWISLSDKSILVDADGDTRVTVEDTVDEDIIGLEAGGGSARLEVRSDSSVFSGLVRIAGSVVAGDVSNRAPGMQSFVGAGFDNNASGTGAFIGTGSQNTASGVFSCVGSGGENNVLGDFSFVNGLGHISRSNVEALFGSYSTDYIPDSNNNVSRLLAIGNGDNDERSSAFTVLLNGQVGIGADIPHPSALLDISTSKGPWATDGGLLIPRHSTTSRQAINAPAQGLLVYDTTEQSFHYYDSTQWVNLNDQLILEDVDGDTKVHVDKYDIDEDAVRFDLEGTEYLALRKNSTGTNVLLDVLNNNSNIMIGPAAGDSVVAGIGNILIGAGAGRTLGNGNGNICIGESAGELATNGFTNIYIGSSAGRVNQSGDNVFIGLNAGANSTTSSENIFLGSFSGFGNTTGSFNTYLGRFAARQNKTGNNNTYVGYQAGANDTTGASGNVLIGNFAGYNEQGSNKLYIENSVADSTGALIWGDFATDMVRINGELMVSGGKFLPFFNGSFTDTQWDDKFGSGLGTWGIAQRDIQDLYLRGLQGVVIDRGNLLSPDGEFAVRFRTGNTTFRTDFLIDKDGNIGVGTSAPAHKLEVCGTLATTAASVTTSITCSSDRRFKQNIATLSNSLTKILAIRGVYYDWRIQEFPEKQFDAGRQIGLIAQEIEPLFPEMVRTDQDGYKSVDYSRLAPVLVEAVKEQQAIIKNQSDKIGALETEVEALHSQLTEIDALKSRLARLEDALKGVQDGVVNE